MSKEELYIVLTLLSLGLLVALALSGCTTIEKGDFKYQSTIFDKKIDSLEVVVDANSGKVVSVKVKNYNSNADYVVEAVKAVAK